MTRFERTSKIKNVCVIRKRRQIKKILTDVLPNIHNNINNLVIILI